MDFGSILDKWEQRADTGKTEAWGRAGPIGIPVRARGIYDKDAENKGPLANAQEKRRRLRNKKPDAELDIHGKNRDEAWLALESFFCQSKERGLEKLLVIHGKGNHSTGDAVLKRVVMDFIEHCPFAGESGKGKASTGGEGVTWVLLKENSRGTVSARGR
ncbi:MAG: Smr/MutS family protein [Treponema sp.]|nr:Smr/MutS family protein [Treponema sp.]